MAARAASVIALNADPVCRAPWVAMSKPERRNPAPGTMARTAPFALSITTIAAVYGLVGSPLAADHVAIACKRVSNVV
jgi:hypothetical protein